METFSRRMGLEPRKALQTAGIDDELRTALWNVFFRHYVPDLETWAQWGGTNDEFEVFSQWLWEHLLKRPLDELDSDPRSWVSRIRGIMFHNHWGWVYNILEAFGANYPPSPYSDLAPRVRARINQTFRSACNQALERESSGYRFVGNTLCLITSEDEIESIENASRSPGGVGVHVQQALVLLSDRESPDYRNSIKESISAVEASVQQLTGKPKATLGEGLKAVGADKSHPALVAAFKKLYGWTSDGDGIRHALSGDEEIGFDEAKFMLVACSAFVNYLVGKSAN